MIKTFRSTGGYSLLEVLLTVSLLGLLLFVVGDAITHVLDATRLGETRQNVARSADELASRLAEEARSSTAVFVPASDVLGQSNGGASGGHEVDFFRKASDGSPTYVAYLFDATNGFVTRYEYVPVAGSAPQIIHQDRMAEHIGSLAAVRKEPASVGGIVGGDNVKPVNIYYGSPELVGGNGIVTVSVTSGLSGEPQRHIGIHLSSRAAPTNVSVLVPSWSPPPSPSPSSSPISVGFLLQSKNKIHRPHGPNHGGDPGNNDPLGGWHGPGMPGTALFVGNGLGPTTADWLSLYESHKTLTEGVYSFRNSDGNEETVTISCDEGPCPLFEPQPQSTTGPDVLFYTKE